MMAAIASLMAGGVPAKMGREEVMLMFRAWREDRAMLRCEFSFPDFAAALEARVVEVSDAELRLEAEDESAGLTLRLRPDFVFWYMDMRQSPQEAKNLVRMVTVIYPYEGDVSNADYIALAEMIEEP
jgi:hypothetical protein